MEKERSGILINFIVRAVIGIGLIFFVNEYLSYKQIEIAVGINPRRAGSGFALWHISVSKFVEFLQSFGKSFLTMDKRGKQIYNTTHKSHRF